MLLVIRIAAGDIANIRDGALSNEVMTFLLLLLHIVSDFIIVLLTPFPPKTNIFVHSKNCTFSKKGLGHKGRCYSVCNDDTCK